MISRSQVQSAQAVIVIPFEELQYFKVVEHGRIHGWKSDQYQKSIQRVINIFWFGRHF